MNRDDGEMIEMSGLLKGVYIFLCRYKFYNKVPDMMRGTVIVIQ